MDPLIKKYPELTPYQFASNTPIWAIDLDGLERYIYYRQTEDKEGKALLKPVKIYSHTENNMRNLMTGKFTNKKYTDKKWIVREFTGMWEQGDVEFDSEKEFNEYIYPTLKTMATKEKVRDGVFDFIEDFSEEADERGIVTGLAKLVIFGESDLMKNTRACDLTIVLGSFKNMENAKKFADGLKKQDPSQEVEILPPAKDGLHRVVVGRFNVRDQRDVALALRNKLWHRGNGRGWLLLTKKKKG